ncbi:class I SAM-dependent methyltransferase [Alkalihalophilus sp. As8PL]|uniref:Class I SAM-dependent methyltransferase n=1 Tax=Alkalihalophilus sp. As8PL TaxID=3237103 RepID=A0AB39BWK9_9BACI
MKHSDIIPFYGGERPELFEIERRCMDRQGKVIEALDHLLPNGMVLDIGAGNGFTAEKLQSNQRTIVAIEPDPLMIDSTKAIIWSKGTAQDVPFHTNTFDAAYSTWAFFFEGVADLEKGLDEMKRIVKEDGLLVIIDNYGEDEFCSLSKNPIASNVYYWVNKGFEYQIIHTSFSFDSVEEARKLLSFYFGENAASIDKTEFEYKVAMFIKKNTKE